VGLSYTAFDSSIGRSLRAESELTWPMNVVVAELGWRGSIPLRPRSRLGASLLVATSLNKPSGAVTDADFLSLADTPSSRTEFSYTESGTRGRLLMGDANIHLAFRRDASHGEGLMVLAGYRHEYAGLDALGYEGWYLSGPSAAHTRQSLGSDTVAGKLHSNLRLPYLGLRWDPDASDGLFWCALEGRIIVVSARINDEHLLRDKRGHGEASGWGAMARLEPRWHLGDDWAIGIDVEGELLNANSGTLQQEFYGAAATAADGSRVVIPLADFAVRSARLSALVLVERVIF
jgi:hypothetical protein